MSRLTTSVTCAIALALTSACGGTTPPPRVAAPAPPPGATAETPTGTPAPEPPRTVTPASPAATPAPLPHALRWVRDAAEYEAASRQLYRVAEAQVEAAARTRLAGGWGVILDADETVISNLTFQIENDGKPYTEEAWAAWAKRREATPMPGAKGFLDRVRAIGGKIVIVTNRRQPLCDDTKAVFTKHALVFDVMLCRTDVADKNPRFEAVTKGTASPGLLAIEVLAYVGDNIQDFPGLTQASRSGGEAAFADFGRRFFVLPNPMYGSWEGR